MKTIILSVLLVFVFFIFFLFVSYVRHRILLVRETPLFKPIGRSVEVNGHELNVFSEGEGDSTLVFMAGFGTCSPVLDFRSLYSLLRDSYRIVVVERAGYGFSGVVDVDRDVASVLAETREALVLCGIGDPFVLCPHSISGIEALYWAQTYPDEVRAIIGLDMVVPRFYKKFRINMVLLRFASFVASIGITRWFPTLAMGDAIKYGSLSAQEKELWRVVFYRRTLTKPMLNEVLEIKKSAARVEAAGFIGVPIVIFSSNGRGTGFAEKEWREIHGDYIQACPRGGLVELDCSHYVHDIRYDEIAKKIEAYMCSFLLK